MPSDYLKLANEDERGSCELLQERSPEPQPRSSKPQVRLPDQEVGSPDPQMRSPEAQLGSPDLQVRSPDSEDMSPEGHIYEVVRELQDEMGDGSCDTEEAGTTCQVLFSFDASSEAELSVDEGETVWLLKSHDLTGNTEWWLVKSEGGAKGYVPASYLKFN